MTAESDYCMPVDRRPWLDMDRAEIAVPGSIDEDGFRSIKRKMAFGYGNR